MYKTYCDVKDCGAELNQKAPDASFSLNGHVPYRGEGDENKETPYEKEWDDVHLDLCKPHADVVKEFIKGLKG